MSNDFGSDGCGCAFVTGIIIVCGILVAAASGVFESSSKSANLSTSSSVGSVSKAGSANGSGPTCRSGLPSFKPNGQMITIKPDGSLEIKGVPDVETVSDVNTQKFLRAVVKNMTMRPVEFVQQEVMGGDLERRLNQAVQLVMQTPEPPCAWHWNDVRANVQKYGWRLMLDGYGRIDPFQSVENEGYPPYSFFGRLLDVEDVSENSVPILAGRIVRMATYVSLMQYVLSQSRYSFLEFETAEYYCSLFRTMWFIDEVAIEKWNVGRFLMALPERDRPELEADLISELRALDRGDGREFILDVLARSFIKSELMSDDSDIIITGGWDCDFPPRLRGPSKGLQFRPLFDFQDPLFNLIAFETLHLSNPGHADNPPPVRLDLRDREATSL